MLEASIVALVLIFLIWAYLLYKFHLSLSDVDPVLSDRIGKPSLFWTAFNGNVALMRLISTRDLSSGPYAQLAAQAKILRVVALLAIASLAWVLWAYATSSAA